MRNEFLRDVIAGSAGVLLVLAVIGLPKDLAAVPPQGPGQGARLLPYYSSNLHTQVQAPRFGPSGPSHPTP